VKDELRYFELGAVLTLVIVFIFLIFAVNQCSGWEEDRLAECKEARLNHTRCKELCARSSVKSYNGRQCECNEEISR